MLHLNILICFGALLPWTTSVVPLDKLFGYGPENGDKEFPKTYSPKTYPAECVNVMTYAGPIELDPPFSLFGQSSNQIHIRDDGTIFVSRVSSQNYDGRIWAFSADVDLRKGGRVYWRKSSTKTDLKKVRDEIGSAFPAYNGLTLKWAVIATWYRVSPYLKSLGSTNTYQAILSTDGNQSFVILNYNEVTWIQANWGYASVGFGMHDRLPMQYDYKVSGSGYPEVATIGNRSNTASNTTGKWIFRIDQTTILEPSSVCASPPQPENGFCTAEEFTAESEALCTCKAGYQMNPLQAILKCSRQADNKTVNWTGNVPVCRSLTQTASFQLPANPSDSAVKLCPLPPIPQYGKCEKKAYQPGSFAVCTCLETYRNTNSHAKLYCVLSEDGNLVWIGGMPTCVNSST